MGCFLWAFAAVAPAYAYDYGLGSYGSGAYNVGQLDATATALTSGTNPSTVGGSVTFTATVSPTTATGTVTFKDGSTTIGTATLGHASGSLTTSALTAGSHSLTAIYAGNVTHSGSTSNVVTQVVNAASGTPVSSAATSIDSTAGTQAGGGGGGGRRRSTGTTAASPDSEGASADNPLELPERRGFLLATIDGREVFFADVPVGSWFGQYVYELLTTGVAQGYRDADGNLTGEFGPANPVTHAEIAKMALLAAGKPLSTGSPRNRSARDDWSAPYVKTAENLGLSVFISSLDVRTPATRGEVIQTVLEAFGVPLSDASASPYADLRLTHPHARAIAAATASGIIFGDTLRDGTPKGAVRPDEPVNRAEVAKIIALTRAAWAE